MKVAIRGKNIEVTDALRAYIEKRLSKLTRYFDDELNAQAVLSVVKDKSTIELTCFVDKIVLRGVETNDDMYAAIDEAADKVSRQLRKYKTKVVERRHHVKSERGVALTQEDLANLIEIPAEDLDDQLVREKYIDLEPMTEEEALVQTDLLGHDFYVFVNSSTGLTNVIYHRKNGGYGIIKPKIEEPDVQ